MFGRHPRIPLTEILEPKIRYLGNDETILSLEALQKMYLIVAENLWKARSWGKNTKPHSHTIQVNDLVMTKKHLCKIFDPKYTGAYRVVSVRGNQAQIIPVDKKGGPQKIHVSHLKHILPTDRIISKIPDYTTFGRKTKLAFHLDRVPDLGWQRTEKLNTPTKERTL